MGGLEGCLGSVSLIINPLSIDLDPRCSTRFSLCIEGWCSIVVDTSVQRQDRGAWVVHFLAYANKVLSSFFSSFILFFSFPFVFSCSFRSVFLWGFSRCLRLPPSGAVAASACVSVFLNFRVFPISQIIWVGLFKLACVSFFSLIVFRFAFCFSLFLSLLLHSFASLLVSLHLHARQFLVFSSFSQFLAFFCFTFLFLLVFSFAFPSSFSHLFF